MQPFNTHRGIVATLDRANVDTDQIIPKQFLKSITRTGFGKSLFFDWRYLEDGTTPDPEFSLNHSKFSGASILVTRNNFGCGSSREHAVWAITQFGFQVVIAPWEDRKELRVPGFADIFRNNAVKNGLLTVELAAEDVDQIFDQVAVVAGLQATVDLQAQTIVMHGEPEKKIGFEIESSVKEHLWRGLDDIALTLEHEAAIAAFEQKHNVQLYSSEAR